MKTKDIQIIVDRLWDSGCAFKKAHTIQNSDLDRMTDYVNSLRYAVAVELFDMATVFAKEIDASNFRIDEVFDFLRSNSQNNLPSE